MLAVERYEALKTTGFIGIAHQVNKAATPHGVDVMLVELGFKLLPARLGIVPDDGFRREARSCSCCGLVVKARVV